MLCSDGMNGMVNDHSMEMMINFSDLILSSQTLIRAALDAGGNDNVTVTLVGITSSPHTTSQFKHFNPTPKFDARSTTDLNSTNNSRAKKKNSLLIYAGSGLILIVLGFVANNFLNQQPDQTQTQTQTQTSNEDKNQNTNKVGDLAMTKKDIAYWPEQDTAGLKEKNINEQDGPYPACNNKYTAIVKDGKVVKFEKNKKVPVTKTKTFKTYEHVFKRGETIDEVVNSFNKSQCKNLSKKQLQDQNPKKISDKFEITAGDTIYVTCECP